MKKSELKDLMLVRLRCDKVDLHLKVNNLLISHVGFMRVSEYNEDLTFKHTAKYDIMEVYVIKEGVTLDVKAELFRLHYPCIDNTKLEKIWERK